MYRTVPILGEWMPPSFMALGGIMCWCFYMPEYPEIGQISVLYYGEGSHYGQGMLNMSYAKMVGEDADFLCMYKAESISKTRWLTLFRSFKNSSDYRVVPIHKMLNVHVSLSMVNL